MGPWRAGGKPRNTHQASSPCLASQTGGQQGLTDDRRHRSDQRDAGAAVKVGHLHTHVQEKAGSREEGSFGGTLWAFGSAALSPTQSGCMAGRLAVAGRHASAHTAIRGHHCMQPEQCAAGSGRARNTSSSMGGTQHEQLQGQQAGAGATGGTCLRQHHHGTTKGDCPGPRVTCIVGALRSCRQHTNTSFDSVGNRQATALRWC